MRRKNRKWLCIFAAAAVVLGSISPALPSSAQENGLETEVSPTSEAVTVTTREEFMAALEQHKSPIVVNNLISIGKDAESDGQMKPVMIPENTLIQGTGNGEICARAPIQLEGDGVCFQNIKLVFESSDALNSVPHREIFLAGHSLTLDNVRTYLEGSGGNLGEMGGSAEELLPTVYAGGYSGTTVGGAASLTVKNSNDDTAFQAIYMGHGAGNDGKIPYQGNAVLNLDSKAAVRETVDVSENSQAEINMAGTENDSARTKNFVGNGNTTLTLQGLSMSDAVAAGVGNIVLKDRAVLSSKTETLQNVTLQNGGCIDFNSVQDAEISGNFTGTSSPSEERGILVLNPEGSLRIQGNVTGTTQFQTSHRLFPGVLLSKKFYIYANAGNSMESNFVLAQKYVDAGDELRYDSGVWSVYREPVREIGKIEIISGPSKVDLREIACGEAEESPDVIPDATAYFEVKWYDDNGVVFDDADAIEDMLYEADYVVKIRTDYWESDSVDILDKTDWFQSVYLMASEDNPGKYYLWAQDGATPGNYTFLFCSNYFEGNLNTVADVKALKDTVKVEWKVTFYNEDSGEPGQPVEPGNPTEPEQPEEPGNPTEPEQPEEPGNPTEPEQPEEPGNPTEPEVPGESEKPGHTHVYQSTMTKRPTCAQTGIRTYICSCGSKYTEEIGLLNHQYTEKRLPATTKSNGKVQKVCSVCSAVKDVAVIYRPGKITWSKMDFSYDGKAKKPSVLVKDKQGRTLRINRDYQIVYPQGRKNPGVYTVTIKFRGDYSGSIKGTFTIRPKKTSLKKLTGKSKGIQVTWKKQTAQMDGYQIQYCTSGNFKGKTLKTTTVKKSAVEKKIFKLKGKKKYYVRIRTYKTVKVNGKNKKLYSDWSGKKSVYTKR